MATITTEDHLKNASDSHQVSDVQQPGPALTSGTAAPSIPSDASVATGALPAAAGGTTFGSQTEVQGMSSGVPSGVTSGVHSGVPSGVHSGVPSNTLSSAGGQGVPPTVDPTAGEAVGPHVPTAASLHGAGTSASTNGVSPAAATPAASVHTASTPASSMPAAPMAAAPVPVAGAPSAAATPASTVTSSVPLTTPVASAAKDGENIVAETTVPANATPGMTTTTTTVFKPKGTTKPAKKKGCCSSEPAVVA